MRVHCHLAPAAARISSRQHDWNASRSRVTIRGQRCWSSGSGKDAAATGRLLISSGLCEAVAPAGSACQSVACL